MEESHSKNHPHIVQDENKSFFDNIFLEKSFCQHYNLTGLVLVFILGALVGFIPTWMFAVASIVIFVPSVPRDTATLVGTLLWGILILWLLYSLVMIGRRNREKLLVPNRELIGFQVLFLVSLILDTVSGLGFTSGPKPLRDNDLLSLEWSIVAFHSLYLLMALFIWKRMPLRIVVAFAIMLGLVVYQSGFPPVWRSPLMRQSYNQHVSKPS